MKYSENVRDGSSIALLIALAIFGWLPGVGDHIWAVVGIWSTFWVTLLVLCFNLWRRYERLDRDDRAVANIYLGYIGEMIFTIVAMVALALAKSLSHVEDGQQFLEVVYVLLSVGVMIVGMWWTVEMAKKHSWIVQRHTAEMILRVSRDDLKLFRDLTNKGFSGGRFEIQELGSGPTLVRFQVTDRLYGSEEVIDIKVS